MRILFQGTKQVLIFCFLGILVACQTVPQPLEDYSLARAALDAARSAQAPRYSPGFWHQAEEAYRKARVHYAERDWKSAKEEFIRSRKAAEKAENSARLIAQKTGEVI